MVSAIRLWSVDSSQPDTWDMIGGTLIWIVATSANITWSVFDGEAYGNRNDQIVGGCDRNQGMSVAMLRGHTIVVDTPNLHNIEYCQS